MSAAVEPTWWQWFCYPPGAYDYAERAASVTYLPRIVHLWDAVLYAAIFTILRLLADRFIFVPIAKRVLPAKHTDNKVKL
jgi:hypothetical protein